MNKLLVFTVTLFFAHLVHCQEGKNGADFLKTSNEFYKTLEYDSAFVYAKKGYAFYKSQKNDSLTFKYALELFKLSDKINIQDNTDYFTIAVNIARKKKGQTMNIDLYYARGNMLFIKNDFAEALPLFLRIDSISKTYAIKNITTINAIIKRSEISRLKFTETTSTNAEKLLFEALKMAEDIKSDEMINLTYTYLADVSGLNKKYEEAKRYIDLASKYYIKVDDIKNVSQLYLVSTAYYLAIDDLENAKKAQTDRLNYLRSKKDTIELARALTYNGSFHRRKTKDYNRAIKSLEEAKILYSTLNSSFRKTDMYESLFYHLAMCYSEIGDYKLAFEHLDLSSGLMSDLTKRKNIELTSTLETKYETAKKEKEIALLTSQRIIIEQQKKNQTYLFFGLLSLGLITGGFLFYGYRNKLKTAQKLKELDTLKSKFFANISHEFRTPLTLIKSPLQLLKNEETDIAKKKHITMIEQHSDRMLTLVDQLLQLSKIDSGNLKLMLQKSNLSSFLESLIEPFQLKASDEGFNFSKQIEHSEQSEWFDKDILEKVITNLLTNALKYTSSGQSISFEATTKNNELQILVSNASAIESKQVSKLFERFYQEQQSNEGVGIGLALVKELVTLYRGTIKASVENGILSFNVVLPLDKDMLNDISIISEPNSIVEINHGPSENLEELPIMLIVDDNADIRLVLQEVFKNDYYILEAPEGATALKMAIENIPDIIISDVMMPKMDGFELTETLKQNEATSFIPIILLTAKTSDESRLKGLQFEADDYLTKPFNHDILKAKVQQLIEVRHKLRDRYSKELILKPTDITINSVDEKFIERLQHILDKHLSDTDFSADDFAKSIGMSRMQLHRKLKSLFGISSTEFLRTERLKAAAILLKKGTPNISEVAYSVGFNDVSYFSKCFKEVYGVTPSDYSTNS